MPATLAMQATDDIPSISPGYLSVADIKGPWWAVHTFSRAERKVAQAAMEADVPYLLPQELIRRRIAGKMRTMNRLIWPSYVFIAGANEVEGLTFPPEFRREQVCKIITIHPKLQEKFAKGLDSLHLACETHQTFGPFVEGLEEGKLVKIDSGPMEGVEGKVLEYDGKMSLLLGLPGMKGHVQLEVDLSTTKIRYM